MFQVAKVGFFFENLGIKMWKEKKNLKNAFCRKQFFINFALYKTILSLCE